MTMNDRSRRWIAGLLLTAMAALQGLSLIHI